MYERSDDWCLCVAGLWFHHKCHPSKVHSSTKHNMGKHAYRAVYKSIQYTEYRVNTESCFLWYVRAVLESIFSTQYSKANSVQILQRTVSLGDSTERSVVPAAACCFLPEGLTPTSTLVVQYSWGTWLVLHQQMGNFTASLLSTLCCTPYSTYLHFFF